MSEETRVLLKDRVDQLIRDEIWPSRTGDIPIRDMYTKHILNAMNVCIRSGGGKDPEVTGAYIKLFKKELKRRKEFVKEYEKAMNNEFKEYQQLVRESMISRPWRVGGIEKSV